MSAAVQEVLNKYGAAGVTLLRDVVPKATGKTAESIRYEVEPGRLVIFARAFFAALETGRGPRKGNEYEGFDNNLLDWMRARGIGSELSEKKRKQLARFLSYRINKQGDKTFRTGGRSVYSQVIAQFVEELKTEIVKVMTKEYTDKMFTLTKEAINGTNGSKATAGVY